MSSPRLTSLRRSAARSFAAAACITSLFTASAARAEPEAAAAKSMIMRAEPMVARLEAADANVAPVKKKLPLGFEASAVVEAPLFVGGEATLELPHGFMIEGAGGVLPTAFVNALDSALVKAGAYNEATSTLVRGALSEAGVARASLGFRPFDGHGFEIRGGYTYVSIGSTVNTRDAAKLITASLPVEVRDLDVPFESTLHCLHASLGWRWMLADHLVVRISAGYMQSVASSSFVHMPTNLSNIPAVQASFNTGGMLVSGNLAELYSTYVKVPLLGLSLGYRF